MTWLRDEPREAWRWIDGNGEVLAEVGDRTMRRAPLEVQAAWVSRIRAGVDPVAAGSWTARQQL